MATLDLDKVTWSIIKYTAKRRGNEAIIAQTLEMLPNNKHHYLYQPISWEILKILLKGANNVQSYSITATIDEEQAKHLKSTMDKNDKWQQNAINFIMNFNGYNS
jgi:hypothetical protein